jgi:hypothetical protein
LENTKFGDHPGDLSVAGRRVFKYILEKYRDIAGFFYAWGEY